MSEVIRGVRAVIFDLDGTLFDSTSLWRDIDDIFLRKRGCVPTDEYYKAISALGFRNTAYFTVDYYKLTDSAETLMAEWKELARDAYANDVVLLDGAREYVRDCAGKGLKIVAVTSLARELAEPCLKNNGIFEFFDEIVTADESGFAKTDPNIFRHAAELIGVACGECVAFDDVASAVVAAKKAGMIAVAICNDDEHRGGATADEFSDYAVRGIAEAPRIERAKG